MAEDRNMEDEDEGGTAAAMCAGETWLSRFVGDRTGCRGMAPSYNFVIYVNKFLFFKLFFNVFWRAAFVFLYLIFVWYIF